MIRLTNLVLSHERHPAVHHVSGSFAKGSLTAIVGPNGAGKTTLLRALAGLHRPDEGSIDLGDLARTDIGLLPQASQLDRAFPLTCHDVVALGLTGRAGALRAMGADMIAAAELALRRVGLAGFTRRPIGSLSTGQFQRVLFARLIAQDPAVVLLDEPFTALDARTSADLLNVVLSWHKAGKTVIAVLHDMDLVRRAFPQTLLLAREMIGWGPTEHVLSAANRLRTRQLSEAWSEDTEICHVHEHDDSHEGAAHPGLGATGAAQGDERSAA